MPPGSSQEIHINGKKKRREGGKLTGSTDDLIVSKRILSLASFGDLKDD